MLSRTAFLTGLLAAVLAVSSAAAQRFPIPLRFVTSDGTWDCKSPDGASIGTVVIVGSAYAFINTDSKVGGYGKLHRHGEEVYDLPHYIIVDGPLKDMGFIGSSMRGPREDYENYSTGIFFVLIPPDDKEIDCLRRMVEGMLQ